MRRAHLLAVVVVVAVVLPSAFAHAAPIDCDPSALSTAIDEANGDPDSTTIELAPDCTYELTTALPDVTSPIVIEGNGATVTRAAEAPAFRFLFVGPAPDLVVRDTAFVGGDAGSELGGAITTEETASDSSPDPDSVQGSITLERVEIRDSVARRGGALHSGPAVDLMIIDSTFAGNSAYFGGAVSILGSAASFEGTTFSGNEAVDGAVFPPDPGIGGALLVVDFRGLAADVTVTNSTFSGNVSLGAVIEVLSRNPFQPGPDPDPEVGTVVRLVHTTVTRSATAVAEGSAAVSGFYADGTTGPPLVELQSSIVADQTSGDDCGENVVSLGHNLDSDDTCGLVEEGDVPAGAALLEDLAVEPGARTATHALGVGSDALDAAGDPCAATGTDVDQVDSPRPVGSACDIGAFESPQARIEVRLETDPAGLPAAGEPPIAFTVTPALAGADTFSLRDGDAFRAEGQPAGAYEVVADLPQGWSAASVVCADPSDDSSTDAAAADATVEAAFEEVVCTFTLGPPEPPTVNAGGPYRTAVDDGVAVTAEVTPGSGAVESVQWAVDDDSCTITDADERVAEVTCGDPGTYELDVTVTDEFGLAASDTAVLDVTSGAVADDEADEGDEEAAQEIPRTGGGAALLGGLVLLLAGRTRRR